MRSQPFDVEIDPAKVLFLCGDCDMDDAPRIGEAFQSLGEEERAEAVLDLGGVTYLGSAGLAVLIKIRNQYPDIRLRRVPPSVRRLLQVACLDGVFACQGELLA